MKKILFWFMVFLGCMFAFLKYEAGRYLGLDSASKIVLNIGLWTVTFFILWYGTPNGFIKGIKNMKKRDNSKQ